MGASSRTRSTEAMSEADDMANGTRSGAAIIYAGVANWDSKQMLVDYTSKVDSNGDCKGIVKDLILPGLKRDQGPPGCCSQYDKQKIYFTSFEEGFSIVHVCTDDYLVKHSLMFQKECAEKFRDSGAAPDSNAPQFQPTLKELVLNYTTNPPEDKFDKVKKEQEKVKQVLIDDIEEAVKRHGKIELVLENTESLKEESQKFQTASRGVRRAAQCQLYKTYACIAGIVILVIGVLIIIICV